MSSQPRRSTSVEFAVLIIGMALAACLKPAFDNRWLRADRGSRLGLFIAFGTLGCFVCAVTVLAAMVVRGIADLT